MTDRRREEAANWHVRLQFPDAPVESWERFTEWLEADPANRLAYDEVELLAAEVAEHREKLRSADDDACRLSAAIVDLAAQRETPGMRWIRPVMAIAAALVALICVQLYFADRPQFQDYQTGPGERRMIVLADGSKLHLNALTQIRATIGKEERQLVLDHGEALFEVAHDAARPFVVTVGEQQVRDVGTVFNIVTDANRMTVTVAEGVVDVGTRGGNPAERVRLDRGKQLVYDTLGNQAVVKPVDVDHVTAWRMGKLVYENAALSQVAADLSRYFGEPIIVDSKAQHLRFTGVLILGKKQAMLDNLEALVPVTAQKLGHGVRISAR